MKHETLLEQHNLLQHELKHAKTVAKAAAEGAQYYRAQLDESTFRQQAAEGHVVQLQQSIATLQRDAAGEKSLLQSLQSVCPHASCKSPCLPMRLAAVAATLGPSHVSSHDCYCLLWDCCPMGITQALGECHLGDAEHAWHAV